MTSPLAIPKTTTAALASGQDAVGEHYTAFRKPAMTTFLSHRGETRGVGGIFFDDWTEGGFETVLPRQACGKLLLTAYQPIFARRMHTPFTDAQRDFQLIAAVDTRNLT